MLSKVHCRTETTVFGKGHALGGCKALHIDKQNHKVGVICHYVAFVVDPSLYYIMGGLDYKHFSNGMPLKYSGPLAGKIEAKLP